MLKAGQHQMFAATGDHFRFRLPLCKKCVQIVQWYSKTKFI
jgi:hypothetical protein